jgi:hypothetical protein
MGRELPFSKRRRMVYKLINEPNADISAAGVINILDGIERCHI